ncbi:hypothetical protein DENSPDRAFT_855706, partial [Dentipellis sp. KUC8613]
MLQYKGPMSYSKIPPRIISTWTLNIRRNIPYPSTITDPSVRRQHGSVRGQGARRRKGKGHREGRNDSAGAKQWCGGGAEASEGHGACKWATGACGHEMSAGVREMAAHLRETARGQHARGEDVATAPDGAAEAQGDVGGARGGAHRADKGRTKTAQRRVKTACCSTSGAVEACVSAAGARDRTAWRERAATRESGGGARAADARDAVSRTWGRESTRKG